jgi:hypothetical protein
MKSAGDVADRTGSGTWSSVMPGQSLWNYNTFERGRSRRPLHGSSRREADGSRRRAVAFGRIAPVGRTAGNETTGEEAFLRDAGGPDAARSGHFIKRQQEP